MFLPQKERKEEGIEGGKERKRKEKRKKEE